MLQSIRDKTSGVITWCIIALICVTFALFGISNYFVAGGNDNVAEVNGTAISAQTFNRAYRGFLQQQQALGGDLAEAADDEQNMRKAALAQLVQQTIMLQAASQEGFLITDTQILSVLKQVPDLAVDGQFSPQRLQQMLTAIGVGQAEFFQSIREKLLITQVQDGISQTAFALPAETANYAQLFAQTRDFDYVVIPYTQFVKNIPDSQFSKDDIDSYFVNNQQAFMLPAKVKLDYVEVSLPALEKKYPGEGQKRFAQMSDKLANLSYENPDSLEVVVSELDLPLQSTGYITQKDHGASKLTKNADVLKAAFSTDLINDHYNSDVISVDSDTLVVVRVNEYQAAHPAPISDAKPQIIKQLKAQRAKTQTYEAGIKLAKQGITEATTDPGYSFHSSKAVPRNADDINLEILHTVFDIPKNASGTQKTIQLENGNVVVVKLNDVVDVAFADPKVVKQLSAQLATDFGKIDYELYRQSELASANVKRYNISQGDAPTE